MTKMQIHWAFTTVLLVNLVSSNEEQLPQVLSEPSWGYQCIPDEGCQRSELPLQSSLFKNVSTNFESLDVCRTVCGRFGGLWPRPITAALSMQTVKIHPKFLRFDLIDVPVEARDLAAKMTHVVSRNLLAECGGNITKIVDTPVVVYLNVRSPDISLTWDTDEQYMLDVKTKDGSISVHISAETVYGARHALESFSQLVSADKSDFVKDQCGLVLVSGAKIRDQPAYKYRGFLLDTSRNFIPLKYIKKMIDAMASTKMNVFHWHVTDSHSFPLESLRVPQFTRYGAYSVNEIYSVEEVKQLIKYAQVRGVRVVIEIDAPAHAGNGWQWGKEYGLGDLAVCVNKAPWRNLCIQPPCGQLNPANPAMYRILKDLYRDIAEVLTRPALLHMGGDEVFFGCWNSTEEIITYMREKGYETTVEGFIQLWAEFHEKALQLWDQELEAAGGVNKQPVMMWSSDLTQSNRIQRYLDPRRYVIEVWEPVQSQLLNQLLRLGYRTVSVPKDVWYLDRGFWGATKYSNWRRMYAHTLPKDPKMLGGEVAMWSEYVDSSNLEGRVWPRAAAVAERLWADPRGTGSAAEPRLQRLRTRLVTRDVRADVLAPAWCSQHDARCL